MSQVTEEEALNRAGGLAINAWCLILAVPIIGELIGFFFAAKMLGIIFVASNQRILSVAVLVVTAFLMFPMSYAVLFAVSEHPGLGSGIALFVTRFLVVRIGLAIVMKWISPEAAQTLR